MSGDVLSPPRPSMNPAALDLADAARLLTAAGGETITTDMIRADVEAGAPVNADGSIHLVHYAAWLVKELAGSDD